MSPQAHTGVSYFDDILRSQVNGLADGGGGGGIEFSGSEAALQFLKLGSEVFEVPLPEKAIILGHGIFAGLGSASRDTVDGVGGVFEQGICIGADGDGVLVLRGYSGGFGR